MDIQSLLFSRADGWTAGKAKEWAKSHGYKHGKVDVTDQYVRLRQFDPKGLKVKRTITLGRGIRAVVARKEDMKRSRKKSAAKTTRRKATRRTRETPVAAEAKRRKPARRRRAAKRARETTTVQARRPRRRRAAARRPARRAREQVRSPRRRRAHRTSGQVMEASRRRRPRRRPARRRKVEAWHGDREGHRKAAKKGVARRRRRKAAPARRRRARESTVMEARRRPRRRSRKSREFAYESPRRRPRRRKARRAREQVMEARRPRRSHRRRSYGMRARGGSSGLGEKLLEVGTSVLAGGLGFIFADAVDRFLATYDPSAATKPTDRFTSDGAGTLANTLNVSATPNLYRIGWAVASTLLPAVGSAYVQQPLVRSGLEGMAVGAGVNAFKLLWQNVIVPLLKPADTSTAGLQKSMVARLYPAEIAAAINLAQKQTTAQGVAFGALSQPPAEQHQPQAGVGAPQADVGPFALAGSSQYPDTASALRHQAGFSGTSEYPDAAEALRQRAGLSGSSPYPDTAQALRQQAGVGAYQPGPPSTPGPGPQMSVPSFENKDCACLGDGDDSQNQFLGFVGDEVEKDVLFPTSGKAAA